MRPDLLDDFDEFRRGERSAGSFTLNGIELPDYIPSTGIIDYYNHSSNTLEYSKKLQGFLRDTFSIFLSNGHSIIFKVRDNQLDVSYEGDITEEVTLFLEYLSQHIPWFESSIIMERDSLQKRVKELESELDKIKGNR